MTNPGQHLTTPTASPLRIAARTVAVAAICAALAAGFVSGLRSPAADASHQVARSPTACTARNC